MAAIACYLNDLEVNLERIIDGQNIGKTFYHCVYVFLCFYVRKICPMKYWTIKLLIKQSFHNILEIKPF